MSSHPNYLMLGHFTKDKVPTGAILGGTCSYSAVTAQKLEQNVVITTSYADDVPDLSPVAGLPIHQIPAQHTTTFENIYTDTGRVQKWHNSATSITYQHIPSAWRKPGIVHFGPIAQEVSPDLCTQFPESLVCVTVQGWLRATDAANTVIYHPNPKLDANLPHIDVLILSLADTHGKRADLEHLVNTAKLGVETLGPEGCRIYQQGQITHVPVESKPEVDPTGAGDIFAAAFFIRYHQTQDPIEAARFANACASFSVGGLGLSSIPSLADVQARQKAIYG